MLSAYVFDIIFNSCIYYISLSFVVLWLYDIFWIDDCFSTYLTVDLITSYNYHDDVILWKHFPCYRAFVQGIHQSPVTSPHKGQWHGALMFSLICTRINDWANNHEAGDLRCHHAHDVMVMTQEPVKSSWEIWVNQPLPNQTKTPQSVNYVHDPYVLITVV